MYTANYIYHEQFSPYYTYEKYLLYTSPKYVYLDLNSQKAFGGIIKTEMYQMYEITDEALSSKKPKEYPIPENKRIEKYKEKWCA